MTGAGDTLPSPAACPLQPGPEPGPRSWPPLVRPAPCWPPCCLTRRPAQSTPWEGGGECQEKGERQGPGGAQDRGPKLREGPR